MIARSRYDIIIIVGLAVAMLTTLTPLAVRAQVPGSSAPQAALKPGTDRWPVKTATDDDARQIVTKPVHITVEELLALPRPADMPLNEANPKYQNHRARGAETTIYTIEAEVVECRLSMDADYHVTVRSEAGQTMVLEIPNPDPTFVPPGGRFARQLAGARREFDTRYHLTVPMKTVPVNVRARITGIGYFGHSSRATEGNLIQLHPLLKIQWLKANPVGNDQVRSGQSPSPTK